MEGAATSMYPLLSVRGGARAVDFYSSALGAREVARFTNDDGDIVAEMDIDGARFHVADEALEFGNASPQALGGTTVRLGLIVTDPDAVHQRAIAAGAMEIFPVDDRPWGLRQGRVVDPFGHHWLFGRPLDTSQSPQE